MRYSPSVSLEVRWEKSSSEGLKSGVLIHLDRILEGSCPPINQKPLLRLLFSQTKAQTTTTTTRERIVKPDYITRHTKIYILDAPAVTPHIHQHAMRTPQIATLPSPQTLRQAFPFLTGGERAGTTTTSQKVSLLQLKLQRENHVYK